ncbi:6-phosphofructo-2-kinase-domain-containing protein [Scheffersomyces xylosifermentans]|uniref:6-phosphofructo-2-kinase-domain-containing protein n=1 Tax=Scheffersomyces xylosifermentans TaxID=1304137 RepID=UPI00315CA7E1
MSSSFSDSIPSSADISPVVSTASTSSPKEPNNIPESFPKDSDDHKLPTAPFTTRHKSNSISNGVLQHNRSKHKKVSFSNYSRNNSSQVFTSSNSSSGTSSRNSSEDERDDDDDDLEDDDEDDALYKQHRQKQHQKQKQPQFHDNLEAAHSVIRQTSNPRINAHLAQFNMSVTPSPNTMSPSISSTSLTPTTSNTVNFKKYYALKKLSSYPYGGEKMNISKSLDSSLLESHSSNSSLPEFNKRPLTDTPIVSSMASPITREQSSADEEEDDTDREDRLTDTDKDASNNKDSNDSSKSNKKSSSDKDEDKDGGAPILKTKNISHLNLADLSMDETIQIEQADVKDDSKQENKNTATPLKPSISLAFSSGDHATKSESVSPMTSVLDVKSIQPSAPADAPAIAPFPAVAEGTPSPRSGLVPLSKKVSINDELRSNLLQDLPLEVQEQFEKTPSIEKLKTLLLTKPPPSARKTYTLNIPGQTSSKTSPDGKIASIDVGSKLVIVMVGLPARGKSYITNKLTRYLNWLQHDCRVFNVGNTRRKDKHNAGPEAKPLPDTHTPNNEPNSPSQHNADFFSPDNKASTQLREKWAMDTLDQLLDYIIEGPGSVGIFDATNSTKSRRSHVLKRIQQRSNGELKVLFLESICSDPAILESNIRLKLSGPDYRDMDPEVALKDFVGRLHNYEKAYETIDEVEEKIPGFQYVKMIDVGKKVVSYNISGFLASQTIYFLLNFNLCERQIWITRHGESIDNLSGRIGGDSKLTKRGHQFSKALARFMTDQRKKFRAEQLERFSTRLELKYNSIFNEDEEAILDTIPTEPNFCVWTSMLYRAVETGQYFNEQHFSIKQMRMLNELGGGRFDGMTYDEIQRRYPKEFDARIHNKLAYRYPGVGGESYLDVLTRLRPLISEIERTTDHLLIIAHRVVLRILLAYFLNLEKSAIGELDVPLHTLYCLESKPYGTDYRMFEYDEKLDWFFQVQPEHKKNIKEVGVVFRERKYSVVPTAPPSSSGASRRASNLRNRTASSNHGPVSGRLDTNNFSIRRSLSHGSTQPGFDSINEADKEPSQEPQSAHPLSNENAISAKQVSDLNKLRMP